MAIIEHRWIEVATTAMESVLRLQRMSRGFAWVCQEVSVQLDGHKVQVVVESFSTSYYASGETSPESQA